MQQTHVKYGLITALVTIIAGIILHLTGLAYSITYQWAKLTPYGILFLGLILNGIAFSNKNNNNVMFGQVFGSNFRVIAVVILITFFWSLISMYLIFPDTKEKVIQHITDIAVKQNLSEKGVQARVQPVKDNFLAFSLGIHTFFVLFFGAVFAVIGAAIAKKKPKTN